MNGDLCSEICEGGAMVTQNIHPSHVHVTLSHYGIPPVSGGASAYCYINLLLKYLLTQKTIKKKKVEIEKESHMSAPKQMFDTPLLWKLEQQILNMFSVFYVLLIQ